MRLESHSSVVSLNVDRFGGGSNSRKVSAGHEVRWENPSGVGLDATFAQSVSEESSDGKASIKSTGVRVAEVRKCTKTDELDGGVRDKIHLEPGIEVGRANVSSIDGGTIGTNNRNRFGQYCRTVEIDETFGDGESSARVGAP